MASGTLVASTTQVDAGGQVTLRVSISDFADDAITLSADNDPGDGSGWQNVTLDANQGASVTVTLANAGSYTFTLNIDGSPALDAEGNTVTAGPITAAAPTTTTTAPTTTTTIAPTTTTTTAPTTTTTTVPTTTTTTAPSTTTTAAPSTTTTAAPSTTTTAAPSTTTTAAPGTTTTAAPSTTTTAGPPNVDDFSGKPKEDDGLEHDPTSLQIEAGKVVVLSWKISGAPDGVELTDPAQSDPQKFDAETLTTEVTPQTDAQDYTLVAVAGDQRSEAKTVHVSTHPAGHVYSPHAQVLGPGQPPVINYFRILAQGGDVDSASDSITASLGATVTLAWEVEGDVAKVEIDNDVGDVTDKTSSSGDASGDGTTDTTLPTSGDSVTFTLTLTPEDSQFQPVTQQVTATLQPATTTTLAPSTTTTLAPSTSTTLAPSTTTTRAPATSTTTAPSATTTAAAAGGSLTVQGFFSFSPFMLVDESGTPVVIDGKNGITTTAIPLGEEMFLFGADGTARFDGLPPGTYHVVYPTETDDSGGPPEPNPDPVQAGSDPVPVPVDNLLNTGFVASVDVKGSGQQSVKIDVTTDNNPSACC